MILAVYKELAFIAENEFTDIVVVANLIFTTTHRAQKLRLSLIDGSIVDVWLTLDGRYSYHWHSIEKIISDCNGFWGGLYSLKIIRN